MAKRMQEQSEENTIVAKSRPTAMNLTSSVATSSSSLNSPIASRSPGILKTSSRQVGLSRRLDASANQNSNPDATSSSQGWQRDAQLFIRNLWQLNTKDVQEIPKFQKIQRIQNQKKTNWPHPIISVFHQTVYVTWRKSSQSQEGFVIGNRRMI